MPAKIKTITASQRPWKGPVPGSDKKVTRRRQGNGDKTKDPNIIANSVFALTLKEKTGVDVMMFRENVEQVPDCDHMAMYNDLMKCFHKCMKDYQKEPTGYDPLKYGFNLGDSMSYIIKAIKDQLVPKGYEFNIDHTDELGYYITAYKHCEFQSFWHCFELKPVVKHWQKRNPALLEIFFLFIKNFCAKTGIERWSQFGIGYADLDYLEEQLVDCEYDTEEEELEAKNNVAMIKKCYQEGEAFDISRQINNSPILEIPELEKALSVFSKRNALVKWIYSALDLMRYPCKDIDFIYPEEEDMEGLRFDEQMAVIWDVSDQLTGLQEEYLDAEANGVGIMSPMLCIRFTSRPNKFIKTYDSMDEFKKCEAWPSMITKLFHQFNEATKYE